MPNPATYPSIEQVFNLARVYLNDTFAGVTSTLGEGRIFIDSWTPNLTLLNEALSDYQRDLELGGVPTKHEEIIFLNLPVVHGVNGPGVADPAVLQYLGFSGFFDGTTLTGTPALPTDLFLPVNVMQRPSSATGLFSQFIPVPGPIASITQTATGLGNWEWRGDALYLNGSTASFDIRMVYRASIVYIPANTAPSAFPTTFIPFMDSMEPLAYRCAYLFSASRLPAGAANDLLQNYNATTLAIVRRYQVPQWFSAPPVPPAGA